MVKGLKRIQIKASELNKLYNYVNELYSKGSLHEYMDADIEYKGNVLRFIHDSNMGMKGSWVIITPINVVYETRDLQRRADLLLLWKPRGHGYRTMVPGKLYEYLDAGTPVLAMLDQDDEAAALVRRAGGEVVPPGKRGPMTDAIERHYLAWKTGPRARPARPAWLDEHTRAALAARLAGLLDGLPRGRP